MTEARAARRVLECVATYRQLDSWATNGGFGPDLVGDGTGVPRAWDRVAPQRVAACLVASAARQWHGADAKRLCDFADLVEANGFVETHGVRFEVSAHLAALVATAERNLAELTRELVAA